MPTTHSPTRVCRAFRKFTHLCVARTPARFWREHLARDRAFAAKPPQEAAKAFARSLERIAEPEQRRQELISFCLSGKLLPPFGFGAGVPFLRTAKVATENVTFFSHGLSSAGLAFPIVELRDGASDGLVAHRGVHAAVWQAVLSRAKSSAGVPILVGVVRQVLALFWTAQNRLEASSRASKR
jgi:hypothetical protein